MNICLCGAQAGYPHDQDCPWPLYRGTEKQQEMWAGDREKRRAYLAGQQQQAHTQVSHYPPRQS